MSRCQYVLHGNTSQMISVSPYIFEIQEHMRA